MVHPQLLCSRAVAASECSFEDSTSLTLLHRLHLTKSMLILHPPSESSFTHHLTNQGPMALKPYINSHPALLSPGSIRMNSTHSLPTLPRNHTSSVPLSSSSNCTSFITSWSIQLSSAMQSSQGGVLGGGHG